ncbi:YhdH/YhfP family quinone oxidoreductase [Dyadobacter sp. CY312]|uniref:YhdH/YhfP family quinone oxidoreductase n=1 Tax=Dyadobacter sp. CY312 TaxID=2907303 RepID=UPI001F459F49|nr:YhdH/YhfP family quinone oxidoreductase [Dyadobacter sp. CY312]MCE7038786.1 YhdH/YhfP family quinone oxidoreductase [Dyadobacter sp. CY312]
MSETFKAFYISQNEEGIRKEIRQVGFDELPQNEVLIRVSFSSINYKDALSASGNKGVTRKYPHVPGIDAAGTVVKSTVPELTVGTLVIVTGFDLGMNTWGGFGAYISVPASWVVILPPELSLKEAMSFGTAGLTAGLSIQKILNAGIEPKDGAIVVSGATGGVGSMATAILSHLGFKVTAISGKTENSFLLDVLGARTITGRNEFVEKYNTKPLSGADFAAGVDNVGGDILSGILKAVKHSGVVTSCGNVASADLITTVFPFILRGITLSGIDSAQAKMSLRQKVWNNLATIWKPQYLDEMVQEIEMDQLSEKLDELLQGKAKGRYVLRHE